MASAVPSTGGQYCPGPAGHTIPDILNIPDIQDALGPLGPLGTLGSCPAAVQGP